MHHPDPHHAATVKADEKGPRAGRAPPPAGPGAAEGDWDDDAPDGSGGGGAEALMGGSSIGLLGTQLTTCKAALEKLRIQFSGATLFCPTNQVRASDAAARAHACIALSLPPGGASKTGGSRGRAGCSWPDAVQASGGSAASGAKRASLGSADKLVAGHVK